MVEVEYVGSYGLVFVFGFCFESDVCEFVVVIV